MTPLPREVILVRQVWLDDLPLPEDVLAAYLAPDERDRTLRRKRPQDRKTAIAARGLLRVLLGCYLYLAPQSVRFVYGKFGKPALHPAQNQAGLSFNVSHSADVVLLAMTQGGELGIDVERVLPEWPMEEAAPALFSESALTEWQSMRAAERADEFWRAWVRREACVKASGIGIGQGIPWPQAEQGYCVEDLTLSGAYHGAVACAGAPRRTLLETWGRAQT